MARVAVRMCGPSLALLALLAALAAVHAAAAGPTRPQPPPSFKFKGYKASSDAATEVAKILAFPQSAWLAWQRTFNVTVPASENATRFDSWYKSAQRIYQLDTTPQMTWIAGFNAFSDMSFEQFATRLKGFPEDQKTNSSEPPMQEPEGGRKLLSVPTSYDWTSSGKVTSVRNQGSCGTCWAFAAIGAIESLYAIKKGKTYDLSEEQLADCADVWSLYWNWDCDGGYASEALRYATNNKIFLESAYGYSATDGSSCSTPSATSSNSVGPIAGYSAVTSKSSSALMASTYTNPSAISFDVVDSFQHYDSGVYSGSDCGTSSNHVMLSVGYVKGSYWKIKNSWGTSWGESGYVRVKFIDSSDSKGTCGMYTGSYRPYL